MARERYGRGGHPPRGARRCPTRTMGRSRPTIRVTGSGPAEATYHRGVASLTTGSTIHRLTRLAGTGTYFHEFGLDVVWTSGDGWYLQVGGAKPNSDEATLPAYIAIDWVHDGQHWVTWDPSGCDITIDKADKSGLAGTAKCKDMRWVDAIVAGLADEPTRVVGQAAFSVRIEFAAAP